MIQRNREAWEYPRVEFVDELPPFDERCNASPGVFPNAISWVFEELFDEPGAYDQLSAFRDVMVSRVTVEVGVSPWASGPGNCERITVEFVGDCRLIVLACEWDDAMLVLLPPGTEGHT